MNDLETTLLWLLLAAVSALVMVTAIFGRRDRQDAHRLDNERDSLAHDKSDFEHHA
jgi:hypothetical protein